MPDNATIPFRLLDLFSGIGGFSLGLERSGAFKTVAFCEIEAFPRKVLNKHWPEVPIYDDVRTLTAERLAADGIGVDAICGGFPCQDISVAGKGAGLDGARSGLWSEIARLVGELRPRLVIVENVANLVSGPPARPGGWFGRILGDLAELGYDAEWENIPASALGAPHRRERIWIVAYASEIRRNAGRAEQSLQGSWLAWQTPLADAYGERREEPHPAAIAEGPGFRHRSVDPIGRAWAIEPNVGRVAHGVSFGVDRIAALGNAVVPQIPELIGRAIMASEQARRAA